VLIEGAPSPRRRAETASRLDEAPLYQSPAPASRFGREGPAMPLRSYSAHERLVIRRTGSECEKRGRL
jgi:hypothetical protein